MVWRVLMDLCTDAVRLVTDSNMRGQRFNK